MTAPSGDVAPEQAATVAFLGDARTHAGITPQRIDTHLSHVFLTPTDVYKLKRAIRLDFVDYATVAARAAYCHREHAANRPFAGNLYRGVLAIRQTPDGLKLDGTDAEGPAIDWVVHMRRFRDADRLDRRLASGQVAERDLTDFADTLADVHTAAPADRSQGGHGGIASLIDQVSGDLANAPGCPEEPGRVDAWARDLRTAADRLSDRLEARREAGLVRRGHGDLHLRNLCYWQGRLIAFDALEFDEALRTTDILYDTAFLVMDLLHAGARPAANTVLSRYLARTMDWDGLAVMDVFLSLRAGVRAMAAALAQDRDTASAYLATAENLLSTRPAPRLFAIGGRSGSGKSTAAARVAPQLGKAPGAILVRSDVTRKGLHGVAPETPLPKSAYGPDEDRRVHAALQAIAGRILAAGWDVIVDATFLTPRARSDLAALAEAHGCAFRAAWLQAPEEALRRRVATRRNDASDADLAVLERQLARPTPLDWPHVDANDAPDRVAACTLGVLDPESATKVS